MVQGFRYATETRDTLQCGGREYQTEPDVDPGKDQKGGRERDEDQGEHAGAEHRG